MVDGRVVTITRTFGLADVRPDATGRLDAIARVVQDAADTDAASAPIADMGVWILRRLSLHVARTPRFREEVRASTWCVGFGPRWAERRTELHRGDDLIAVTTALWVHTDRRTGAPQPLPAAFHDVWGATAAGRRVSARLRHDPPAADAQRRPWMLRAADLDVVGHVNNAAYWAAVEDELARRGRPHVVDAEIEFRSGLDLGDDVETAVADVEGGFALWLTVGTDVRASVLVGCGP